MALPTIANTKHWQRNQRESNRQCEKGHTNQQALLQKGNAIGRRSIAFQPFTPYLPLQLLRWCSSIPPQHMLDMKETKPQRAQCLSHIPTAASGHDYLVAAWQVPGKLWHTSPARSRASQPVNQQRTHDYDNQATRNGNGAKRFHHFRSCVVQLLQRFRVSVLCFQPVLQPAVDRTSLRDVSALTFINTWHLNSSCSGSAAIFSPTLRRISRIFALHASCASVPQTQREQANPMTRQHFLPSHSFNGF
jgi:hypothetical protein